MLCTSSRTWLLYHYQNRFHLTPLSYKSLEFAAGFCSDQCAEGIVAIAENTLRYVFLLPFQHYFSIIAVEKLGASFNQLSFPLKYTPRKMVVHPTAGTIMVIESDHASYTDHTKDQKRNEMANVGNYLI